jgi:hypothetical protein
MKMRVRVHVHLTRTRGKCRDSIGGGDAEVGAKVMGTGKKLPTRSEGEVDKGAEVEGVEVEGRGFSRS